MLDPLLALKVTGYDPTVPAAGVPDRTPVPLPDENVTPVGKVPDVTA